MNVTFNQLKSCILQGIALLSLNIIAFVYDGQYIPVALGIDALILGFDLKAVYNNSKEAKTA